MLKPFNPKRYGLILNRYPNRLNFNSYEDLENIVQNNKHKYNKLEIDKWIEEYAGPLPPSDFAKRVFQVIYKVLNSK